MRSLWTLGKHNGVDLNEAKKANEAADESRVRGKVDHELAVRLRESADQAAADVRAHNSANRYDDFLRRVVQGRE